MSKNICIYHGNCADGFTAAWVVHKYLKGDVVLYPGVYQNPPPDVKGKNVFLVDFSYKREVIEKMRESAASILIIDHHKTAIEDLKHEGGNFGIPLHELDRGEIGIVRYEDNLVQDEMENVTDSVYCFFDLERSGAGLAWDFFFPEIPRPWFIIHVEDRDLWRFKYQRTREIQAAIFSYEYNIENWNRFENMNPSDLVREGEAIERKHFKDIRELTKVVTRIFKIGGYNVPVANLPYTLTSDAGHLLCEGYPFAGCYWDTPDGRVFSLRSREDGMDVGEIAKLYGGGGHAHASGFRVSYGHELTA